MVKVKPILDALQNTTKRNEKIDILTNIRNDHGDSALYLFKRICVLAYSPNVRFWIKEIEWPETTESGLFEVEKISLDKALDILVDKVSKRVVTGNAAINLVKETYESLEDDDRYVFRCVLDRDLKSGVSVKTINKVWPDLVYDHPYMRASSFTKKNLAAISFPCFSQTKEDGEYEDILCYANGFTEQRARSGAINTEYLSLGVLNAIESVVQQPLVLMGEILAFEDNTRQKLLPRQKSNGYLNSNDVDPDRLLHVLWDVVHIDDFKAGVCKTPYEQRFDVLRRLCIQFEKYTDQIKLIDSRMVSNIDDVVDHLKENLESGLEGTMLKNVDMAWKNGTSKDQVKVKVEFECDLKIVGFNQGKERGEYVEEVGSIIYESSEGLINVNVGTGLSDEERKEVWKNRLNYLKKISTIKSNDVITNDLNPDKYSLFLPRITKLVRNDKSQPDSYDRVIEQKEAFIETLNVIKERG